MKHSDRMHFRQTKCHILYFPEVPGDYHCADNAGKLFAVI